MKLRPSRLRLLGLPLITFLAIILLGVFTNLATGATLSEWSRVASIVSALTGAAALAAAAVAAFLSSREINATKGSEFAREQLALSLIKTFAAIEKEAALRAETQLHGKVPSFRDIRAVLVKDEVWSFEDQLAFDLTVRVRNAVVHGDLEGVPEIDLQYASEKAKRLLKKIEDSART